MNSRVLLIVAMCAAAAMCAYIFFGGESTVSTVPLPSNFTAGASAGQQASGTAQPANHAGKNSDAEKKPAVNWRRFAALMNGSGEGAEQIPEPSAEEAARFLAKHGETPANLVVAFQQTRDRSLLDRALELFPNSPLVLMAAVESIPNGTAPKPGETYVPDAQRMAFIERFKAADPNNPLPWIFTAQELFKSGRSDEAVADLRAALDRPAFYTYSNERMDSAQKLYEDIGLHPTEAGLLAMAGMTLPHTGAAMQSSRGLMDLQQGACAAGDRAAENDALRLTYGLGRTFATPEASRTLIGQLVGIAMEKRALEALPADASRDWLTVVPAQRLGEMEKQKATVKELTASLDWVVQSQNEPLLAEYLRRFRNDGELSALTWLKTQKK